MTDLSRLAPPVPTAELAGALAGVRTGWEELGTADPLWAIRTDPSCRGGAWHLDDLFATGEREVAFTMARLDALAVPRKRSRAFDFGCGVGRVTQALASEFAFVVGVDVAASMLERARALDRSGSRVRYVQNTEPDLARFDDRDFDLVYSKLVLQHMPTDLGLAYLGELARLVAPGGALVVQVPSAFRGLDPLPADAYYAEVVDATATTRVLPGARVPVCASVRNCSARVWPGSEAQLAVGAFWRAADGSRLMIEEGRSLLADDIRPGEKRDVMFALPAPARPGHYQLVVDVVHDGVAWFSERAGGAATIAVRVQRRPVRARLHERLARARRPAPSEPTISAAEIEMHGIAEAAVVGSLTDAGLTLVSRDRDHAAPGWQSATYYATR